MASALKCAFPCTAALLASLLSLSSCGQDESACARVAFHMPGTTLLEQVEEVHLRLSDEQGVFIERTYDLEMQAEPTLLLCRGERTPERLTLVAYGIWHGDIVAESEPVEVVLQPGFREIRVELLPHTT